MSDRTDHVTPEASPMDLPAPPKLRDYTKLPLVIIAAMFVAGAVLYPSLPSPFPSHWGISGAPDAFSTKSFGSVFFMPMMAAAIYALLLFVPKLDPKRRSLKMSMRAYNIVIDAVVGMEAVIFAATMFAAYHNGFEVAKVVLVSVGVLFMVVGNYMTTVKQNWTFGLRVSWTLSDEVVWRRANRLGGYLFVATGVVAVLSAFLPTTIAFFALMASVLAMLVITYVYSYLLFRSRHPEA